MSKSTPEPLPIATIARPATKIKSANPWREFLCVEKMDKDAIVPTKGSAEAAGYDLYSFEDAIIPPMGSYLFKLKIKMAMPAGMYGRIASRSGLAAKHGIEVGAGVIDNDYRGEIMVLLRNLSSVPYQVKPKDRIAQIIFEIYTSPKVKAVSSIEQLFGRTERDAGGIGSTGL